GAGVYASTLGWTGRADGHTLTLANCPAGPAAFDGKQALRIPLSIVDTRFAAGDVQLNGRLVMPSGDGPFPLAVIITGSEDPSPIAANPLHRELPAQGIAVFVYDKRGTGQSGGAYTQDFATLAADAQAAMGEAKRLAGKRISRAGFIGLSLGGWVAPLAADKAH